MNKINLQTTTWCEVANKIDYSQLWVDTRERDLRLLSLEAEKFQIPTVVVNPNDVSLTKQLVRGTDVKVAAAVSYPVGAYPPDSKRIEIKDAIEDGADEIYMVMAVGAYLNGWKKDFTIPEMKVLVETAEGRRTTMITEACVLSEDQKREVINLAIESGIGFLAAGAGFKPSKLPDPSDSDLEFLVKNSEGRIGIVYMGEISSLQHAQQLFDLGISRLCTPSARKLLSGFSDFPGLA